MAARFRPRKYTFPSTAAVTLFTALGSSVNDKYGANAVVRAAATNTGTVYWQDADGNQGGYLDAREAITIDLSGMYVSTEDIYLQGPANDAVYITVIG